MVYVDDDEAAAPEVELRCRHELPANHAASCADRGWTCPASLADAAAGVLGTPFDGEDVDPCLGVKRCGSVAVGVVAQVGDLHGGFM